MSSTTPGDSRSSLSREENVDLGRYLATLRRNLPLMVAIVVILTGTVLLASLIVAKSYSADAQIIYQPPQDALTPSDAGAQQRELATLRTLVDSPTVLGGAAHQLNRSERALADAVTASVDQDANLITILATDPTAVGSARVANAVARSFIDSQAAVGRERVRAAQATIDRQIQQLTDAGSAADADQLRALRDRAAQLSVARATAGSDLDVARAAVPPDAPSTPRPFRNAVLALFASIFIAILVALAREQIWPRVSSGREIAQLLELPVLATLPERRGRLGLRRAAAVAGAELEGYRALSTSLRLALPPDRQHVVLVSSALHAEGKTSIVARLGRHLAASGNPTLLVSADLRWPRLDAAIGVEGRDGLASLLARDDIDADGVRRRIVTEQARGERSADVLPAGITAGDGAAEALVDGAAVGQVFKAIAELDYTYVLVDAPPLLGIGDTQLLAAFADELLVVARLESLKLTNVIDLRAMLDRLPGHPLGAVVIGGHVEVSPYYSGMRPALVPGEPLLPR